MVSIIELRGVYQDPNRPGYRAVFDYFSSRTINSRVTTVDRVLQVLREQGVTRRDVVGLFKVLERLSIGKFCVGRHSQPSRFIWEKTLKSVGLAAAGDSDELFDFGSAVETNAGGRAEEPAESEVRRRWFPLRKGLDIELKLPANLTTREAARLAAFIQSLAVIEVD